jgi:hypothetical protein
MSDWWASLRHGGLLLSPSKVAEFFPLGPEPLPAWLEERLRRDLARLEVEGGESRLLDTVLEQVLGLGGRADADSGAWVKGGALSAEWTRRSITGEAVRPRRVWQGPHGAVLPVFFDDQARRLGVGRGRRAVARMVEWLRRTEVRLGLLTNARQFRLVHAGLDHEAWAEWDTDLWFLEGAPGPQVDALRALLSRHALAPAREGQAAPLRAAIEASRKGQAELSSVLGERVRQAVEVLIREYGPALAGLQADPVRPVSARDIYRAATRVVMRMVVLLFSEALDLLPRENALYHDGYSLQGLREALDRVGASAGSRAGEAFWSSGAERLRSRPPAAWPRVLALFRLVHEGSPHEALPVRRYGGALFEPGDPSAADPIRQALAVLEDPTLECLPGDAAVRTMLELLTRSKVRVRQGNRSVWVEAPVDFADLSSEYIGILYEGLLDFELRHVAEEDPVVFLALGDEPALPLSRLEAMDAGGLRSLVEKFKKPSRSEASEEEGEETDEEEAAEEEAEEPGAEADSEPGAADQDEEDPDDRRRVARERAVHWALRAVEAGKMVRSPSSRSPEALARHEQARQSAARSLIRRVVLPGEWYLVRFGGTRKGSGTFYTRPQLAIPTVRRTLHPLLYTPPDGREEAPTAEWTVRPPEELLALKVCDPACGSGSFLIAALRYLAEALWESLLRHGWLTRKARGQGSGGPDDRLEVTLEEGARPPWFAGCVRDMPVDAEDAESRVRARLRRHVVERCLYGVDLDPLAVELCRVALWVETMDRDLPFTFLDHKVKCGNSLVGCWFDRFQDYPALAWERKGGDETHTNGVHYPKEAWTRALKAFRGDRVKPALGHWIDTLGPQQLMAHALEGFQPETTHDEAVRLFEELHAFEATDAEAQARFYRERVQGSQALQTLREAFDRWCAAWFWPADQLEHAPLPGRLHAPSEPTRALTAELRQRHRFFHWELEFPDVFQATAGPGTAGGPPVHGGFDAMVGNPPWEIQKPNSKEFFSNLDPLYRTYGKQEALARQTALFRERPRDESAWLSYNADFKAMSNLVKNAASPFGDGADQGASFNLGGGSKRNEMLHCIWAGHRRGRRGHADPAHPFRHQGSADLNTYKMFLEQAWRLLAPRGQLGLVVPSGVYTDKGTSGLRELFLDHGRWRWLFGFENREKIFPDVDGRFKFCPVLVQKGGRTQAIQTAFMQRDLADWEQAERHAIPYGREQVLRFSPHTRAVLELRSRRDLEILAKIYANSVLLGDDGPEGWGIRYATEFHMTNDSKLFPPRPRWEEKGYRPDEYGRWLLGGWRAREAGSPAPPEAPRWELQPGVLLSRDGREWIHESEVRDTALPLYEGRMIGQFDFSQKGWVEGKGRSAVWGGIEWSDKLLQPQYLMAASVCAEQQICGYKIPVMSISSSTNSRTVIGAFSRDLPCNHSLNPMRPRTFQEGLALAAILNSYVFDLGVRLRMGGLNLSFFILDEVPVPACSVGAARWLSRTCGPLSLGNVFFAGDALVSGKRRGHPWRRLWALTPHERLRLRCELDAVVALLYGLDQDDLAWILRDCDHPVEGSTQNAFTRTLDPKGFWRVDKDRPPELRHTVLTLAAFHDLQEAVRAQGGDRQRGIEAFCNGNDGDGWMLPETLTLADLGLGHDDRARTPQPVRSQMGERFYPFQLQQSAADSWAECELHARNLLGDLEYRRLKRKPAAGLSTEGTTDRHPGQPHLSGTGRAADQSTSQGLLFDDHEPKARQGTLWE